MNKQLAINTDRSSLKRLARASDRAVGVYVLALIAISNLYVLAYLVDSKFSVDFANIVVPILLLFASLFLPFYLVRSDPINIWAPFTWFSIAVSVFVAFGPLVYYFGNDLTIGFLQSKWHVSDTDLLLINSLNILGVILVSVSFYLTSLIANKSFGAGKSALSVNSRRNMTLVILVVGIVIKYFFALPYEFGASSTVLPGVIYSLAPMTKIALFLLAYMAAKNGGAWSILFVTFGGVELYTDFLRFSKSEFILTLVMPFLGIYYYRRKTSQLVMGLLACLLVYGLYTPIVKAGRLGIMGISGNISQASLSTRKELAINALTDYASAVSNEEEVQRWWTRLSYADVQVFAVDRYRDGMPGDSMKYVLYTLIPRAIWPEKPVMSSAGIDFTELYSGHRGSSTGLGVFIEGYWNGGVLFLAFISVFIGFALSLLTKSVKPHLREDNFFYIPVAFMGIDIGMSISKWFVSGFLGALVILVFYYLALRVVLSRRRKLKY